MPSSIPTRIRKSDESGCDEQNRLVGGAGLIDDGRGSGGVAADELADVPLGVGSGHVRRVGAGTDAALTRRLTRLLTRRSLRVRG